MRKYIVIIETGIHNCSAYIRDLPGCITTGRTIPEIEVNIREAIELHLEGMKEDGLPIPEPASLAIKVELPAKA